MADEKDIPPLAACGRFLVAENRNSDLSVDDRLKIQRRTLYGKILGKLYRTGWAGGFLFLLFSVYKRDSVINFRNMIIADHSSRVIHNSLKRVWGAGYEKNIRKNRASLLSAYVSLFSNYRKLKSAYKIARVAHVTEYVRLIRLFHFYIVWKAWFQKNKAVSALIARTNDQNRLALGVAVEELNIPLALFTIARTAIPRLVPFAVAEAFCWTTLQAKEYQKAGVSALRMPVPFIKEMKLPVPESSAAVTGMLLNAKVDVQKLKDWIAAAEGTGIRNIQLRPHPGYDVSRLYSLDNVSICDWHQPLGEYLDSLDMVFALNTHAVIEALLHGVPVVYIGGLDPYEFDLHGFVQSGITIAYSDSLKIPQEVSEFYGSDKFKQMWNPNEFETDPGPERAALEKLAGSS